MINLIKNELLKIFFNRKFHIAMALISAIHLIPVILSFMSPYKIQDGQSYPLFFFGFIVYFVLPIFIPMVVADMIAEEYSSGTLSLTLIQPISRGELLLAKILSLYLTIIAVLIYALISAYLIGTIFFSWGAELIYRGVSYSTAEGIFLTTGLYLVSSFPFLSYGIGVILFAFLFQNTGGVVGVSIGLIIVCFAITGLMPNIQSYFLSTYFGAFSHLMLLDPNIPERNLAVKVIGLHGVIFYLANFFVFSRKDLLC